MELPWPTTAVSIRLINGPQIQSPTAGPENFTISVTWFHKLSFSINSSLLFSEACIFSTTDTSTSFSSSTGRISVKPSVPWRRELKFVMMGRLILQPIIRWPFFGEVNLGYNFWFGDCRWGQRKLKWKWWVGVLTFMAGIFGAPPLVERETREGSAKSWSLEGWDISEIEQSNSSMNKRGLKNLRLRFLGFVIGPICSSNLTTTNNDSHSLFLSSG